MIAPVSLLALSVLLQLHIPAVHGRLEECDVPPPFAVNNGDPVSMADGSRLTMVALLTSTCSFCVNQAERMQNLRQRQWAEGRDVRMMIINGVPNSNPVFENIVSFDVLQDDSRRTIWRRVLRGRKDDIFIFNRCGRLLYRIPFPYSFLGYPYVRSALNSQNNANRCPCRSSRQRQDRMMGDAPYTMNLHDKMGPQPQTERRSHQVYIAEGGHHYSVRHRSRCARDDQLCKELRRGRRRFNRFRRQHGINRHSTLSEEEILELFERDQTGGMAPPTF